MDFPFEGIPTIPPRKDMDHMASNHNKSDENWHAVEVVLGGTPY